MAKRWDGISQFRLGDLCVPPPSGVEPPKPAPQTEAERELEFEQMIDASITGSQGGIMPRRPDQAP